MHLLHNIDEKLKDTKEVTEYLAFKYQAKQRTTDLAIAEFYGLSNRVLTNWKKQGTPKQRLYFAYKLFCTKSLNSS